MTNANHAKTFALIDANNFFVSCERLFNPLLQNKPVVVLSNNDGCIISRSQEAKDLGIPMGAPLFKYRQFIKDNNVFVFSSNYQLYGDISKRIMESLREFVSNMEVYSIDEAFLELDSSMDNLDLLKYTHEICDKVEKWVGIPLSIGIGATKTLAKLANHMAKKNRNYKVFDLRDKEVHNSVFSDLPVGKVWGIGRKTEEKLRILNINTARNLRDSDPQMIRSKFSVVIQRIVFELRGIPCLDLETIEPRQNITSSRSFGRTPGRLEDLEEAIANYTAKAAIRLRKQKGKAQGINIFICANRFSKTESAYIASNSKYLIVPTNDTMILISSAKQALKEIYNPKYQYEKVGIILLNIIHDQNIQTNLFTDKRQEQRRGILMATMDKINRTLNEEAIFIATQGTNRHWKTKSNMCSNGFTTKWEDLCWAG